MAKTYQNIVDEARVILQDTDADIGYRYTDVALLAKLNRAMQELGRLRPDAFFDQWDNTLEDILVPEVVASGAVAGQVNLSANFAQPMQFYGSLVYFVTASAEFIDDEFTNNGRAATLLGLFKSQVVSL